MSKGKTYQANFIAGIQHLMAERGIDNLKAAGEHLGIAYMSLYKIMDGTRNPTVEQCTTLCLKAGYSANWLFLNSGEMVLKRQITLEKIGKAIDDINAKLK